MTTAAELGITKKVVKITKNDDAVSTAFSGSNITTELKIAVKPNQISVDPKKLFLTPSEIPTKKCIAKYESWDLSHPATRYLQDVKKGYVFQPEILCTLIGFNKLHEPGDNLLFHGPTGCGKTSRIRQYHACLNIPLVVVSVNEDTRFERLLGRTTLVKEDGVQVMKYVLGPLGIALFLDIPILIDEVHKLNPGQATGFHALMDGDPIALEGDGGTVLRPGKEFRLYMTSNTTLGSDHTRLYRGSKTQDIAFTDRTIFVGDTYADEDETKMILQSNIFAKQLPDPVITTMVKTACGIQKAFLESCRESGDGFLTKTLSIRKLEKWVKQTVMNQAIFAKTDVMPIVRAFEQVLLAACNEVETRAILQIFATHLKGDDDLASEDEFIRYLAKSLQDPKGLDVNLQGN